MSHRHVSCTACPGACARARACTNALVVSHVAVRVVALGLGVCQELREVNHTAAYARLFSCEHSQVAGQRLIRTRQYM